MPPSSSLTAITGQIELSRELREPARERRHAVARLPVRCSAPHELQVTDNDQIKHAAAHCDPAGPRTQARARSTLVAGTSA